MTRIHDQHGHSHAFASWLASVPWDHFMTLTFHGPVSLPKAERAFTAKFIRWLEQIGRQRVEFAGVVAPGWNDRTWDHTGRTHIHAVTSGTSSLSVSTIAEYWEGFGLPQIRLFNAQRHGLLYICQHLSLSESQPLLRDKRLSGAA